MTATAPVEVRHLIGGEWLGELLGMGRVRTRAFVALAERLAGRATAS